MTQRKPARFAFTMVEVFAVLLIIGVLVAMLLPAVQSAREAARRSSCANNLIQISLGLDGYHRSFGQYPVQMSGTDGSVGPYQDNNRQLSAFVALLPFIDRENLSNYIQQPHRRTFPIVGDPAQYDPYRDVSENEMFDTMIFAQEEMMFEQDMMMEDDPFGNEAETSSESPATGTQTAETEYGFWPAGGAAPSVVLYGPWRAEVASYRCPSDPGVSASTAPGLINYAVCLGDAVLAAHTGPFSENAAGEFVLDTIQAKRTDASMRGAFVPRVVTRRSDLTDGLSHTLLLGEQRSDLNDQNISTKPIAGPGPKILRDNPHWARDNNLVSPDRPRFWDALAPGRLNDTLTLARGLNWADGLPLFTGFNTILPPNREVVMASDTEQTWGILPASSFHLGGAHVLCADGAVRFITDSIDAGASHSPTVYPGSANPPGSQSPYGVWGALGTRAASELRAWEE